jgi:hypothetical protein
MLALKKKREAEAKAAAEAASTAAASTTPSSAPSSAGESTSSADNKVSLLGIGGKKKTKENGGGGKKRTPGEIRIQKGKWCICIVDFLEWLFEHCFVVRINSFPIREYFCWGTVPSSRLSVRNQTRPRSFTLTSFGTNEVDSFSDISQPPETACFTLIFLIPRNYSHQPSYLSQTSPNSTEAKWPTSNSPTPTT